MLGFYENFLMLGLPLLAGLNTQEARAVIAHEFGHFSGKHGRFGTWTYRTEMVWSQIDENLKGAGSAGLIRPFLRWFSPRFAALTFPIVRVQEYEADRAAASIVDGHSLISALKKLEYLDRGDGEFARHLADLARTTPSPPGDVADQMVAAFSRAPDPVIVQQLFQRALAVETGYDDTHPSLTDRMAALNVKAADEALAEPAKDSALDTLFGRHKRALLDKFNAYLSNVLQPKWIEYRETIKDDRAKIEQLAQVQKERSLELNENVELGFLHVKMDENGAAANIFGTILSQNPDNGEAHFGLAKALADERPEEALNHVRKAREFDAELTRPAFELEAHLLQELGRQQELVALREEMRKFFIQSVVIHEESLEINPGDDFQPHKVDPSHVETLAAKLSAYPEVLRAYLVNKILPFGKSRLTVIVIRKKVNFEGGDASNRLTERLCAEVPMPSTGVYYVTTAAKAWEHLGNLPGSLIVDRLQK